jgi:hypothetical protein
VEELAVFRTGSAVCSGAEAGKKGTQTCTDLNKCNPLFSSKTQGCTVQAPYFKTQGKSDKSGLTTAELPQSTKTSGGLFACTPNFKCDEWSDCNAVYNLDKIIQGGDEGVLLDGEQTRVCKDSKKCAFDKIERQTCDTKVPVIAKKVEQCFDDYIDIYDTNGTLISRLKLINGTYQQLTIQMLFESIGYCPYCYDDIKNYDEDEVDCVYDGKSCPVCGSGLPVSRTNYLWWIIFGVLIFFISIFLILYLDLRKKEKKRKKNILKMSNFIGFIDRKIGIKNGKKKGWLKE